LNDSPPKPDRIAWVDFLRSIAIFLVIVIHTAGPLAYQWENIPRLEWMAGNFYNAFARVSVPLLFMVSGYLLLGKQESISDFYTKRFRKVFVPFLFWSVFYLVWENGYRDFTFFNAIKAVVYALVTTPASFHMWFLYELLAIYLFVPLIRVFIASAERIHLWYFAAVWFLFGPVLEMTERMLGIQFAIDLGFLTSYIGFFIIGYLLGQIDFPARALAVAAAVYILAGIYTMLATYSLTSQAGDYVQYYYWYTRINIVLMSVSAFVLLKKLGEKVTHANINLWFARFAQASFGIYLIHVIVLVYLRRAGISAFSGPAAITVPAVSLLIAVISWGLVAVIQRIPVLRELAPR
jgi:surface polysaccharide O-acyltransferase-like enzyme